MLVNDNLLNIYDKSIVKIKTDYGIGTGFIVTDDGIICTCYHVIESQIEIDIYSDIVVYFPQTEQYVKAIILKDEKNNEPYIDTINDIAFLQIKDESKKELKKNGQELIPVPLSKSISRLKQFLSRGFKIDELFPDGLCADGKIQCFTTYKKLDDGKKIQVIQLKGTDIDYGMSGSPVLDLQKNKVIGMINGIYDDEKAIKNKNLVLAIPVNSIVNVYPSLSEKNPGLSLRFSEDNPKIEKILNNYVDSLEKRVSKVRLLGEDKEYDLTQVFVDLIINEQYDRPSFQSLEEYKGMMDSELRKKRFLFNDDQKEDDKNKGEKDKEKKIRNIKPDELSKSNKKTTIIVGAPGSGKSTLIRYLVNKTIHQKGNKYFPVYLELKKIRTDFSNIENFEDIIFSQAIISQAGINNKEKEKSILETLRTKMRDGKIAFFLDGLDEMKEIYNDSQKTSLRELFDEFIEKEYVHRNLIIVTTRPYVLQGGYERHYVQEMEIAPFMIEQIKQFIQHYYGYDNPDAKKFLYELSTRNEIQELARVPLLLGFLLQMYIESKLFYENKLDIYNKIVTYLNNKLDKERRIKRNFKTKPLDRIEVLKNLAFSGLMNFHQKISNRLVFSEERILDEVTKYCSENPNRNINHDDLSEDIKMTALLREIGDDEYAFTHLTIQEYLAAKVLIENKNLDKLFCQAYIDPIICEMEVLPITIGLSQKKSSNRNINLYELLEKLPESQNFANFRLRVKGLGYSSHSIEEKYLTHIVNRLIEFITEKKY